MIELLWLAIRWNVHNVAAIQRTFLKLSTKKKPERGLVQVVMIFGVHSSTVPVQKLHVNIKIIYQLLLWMHLNQYLGTLLVQIYWQMSSLETPES
jgi:hypothetical protein